MKALFFLLFITVFSFQAFAIGEKLRIENIDLGRLPNDYPHIYLSNGKIGVLKSSQLHPSDFKIGQWVNIDLDSDHTIRSIVPLKVNEKQIEITALPQFDEIKTDYNPTILPNIEAANTIFKRMNRRWQRESQCYNRAHIWNYEEFKNSGLLSKKVFIFFTRRYIRNYNFYWWFHAIPTVFVNHDGSAVERALDPRYTRGPLPMKTWSDVFVRSRRTCPVITKYSTYTNNQQTEDCYLHYSSMYYWQPRDLDRYERTGYEKNSFINSEINWAYREAF